MSIKYIAKPITCECIQVPDFNLVNLESWFSDLPKWFKSRYVTGKIQVTHGVNKESFVDVKSDRGGWMKACEGMWICLNEFDIIFVMSEEEFKHSFEKAE